MSQCMATTIDNPYNPFTHFDEWLSYDMSKHYNTSEIVAYFSKASSNMDEEEYNDAVNYGIDRLLELNPLGLHMKVYDYEADALIPLANKAYEVLVKEQTS